MIYQHTPPDLMFRMSTDGIFLSFYTSSPDLLALPPEAFIGKRFSDIFPADTSARLSGHLHRAKYSKTITAFSYTLQIQNQPRSFDAFLTPANHDELFFLIYSDQHRLKSMPDRELEAAMKKLEEERRLQHYLCRINQVMADLETTDNLDTFCRKLVELSVNDLDFERFALFLYDEKRNYATCTYGVDKHGAIIAAHEVEFEVTEDSLLATAMQYPNLFHAEEDITLWTGQHEAVGTGWNAAVALSHSGKHLGWLVADNLLRQIPLYPLQSEIMIQLAITAGAMLAHKQLEQQLLDNEARYRQMIDRMGGGITIYDESGKLIYVNDRICEINGYSREELLEHGVLMTIDPEHDAHFTDHSSRRDQGDSSTYELKLIRKDKRRIWVLVNGSPLFDGNNVQIGSFAITIDITDQKEAQETLRRALEREQELSHIQSEFVSTTSHEFRTPLAIILATTETLHNYRSKMSEAQINERLERIQLQVHHLRRIMDDVLNLTSMQHRRVGFAPVVRDLRDLLQEIIEEFSGSAQHVDRIRAHLPERAVEYAYDPRFMRQILQNLISNALKYSAQSRSVDITLTQDSEQVIMAVQDYGIGIPQESLDELFKPFYRASNVGKTPGTGLGMVIVKEAVEIHGGTIEIDSLIQQGTTIRIRLPKHA